MNIQHALSELLKVMGFTQMSIDVKNEHDHSMLVRYANVIRKHAPSAYRDQASKVLTLAGL